MLPSNPKYDTKDMNVGTFLADWISDIDCMPIGQRPPIAISLDNSKSIEIIESMFLGINLGQITIVRLEDCTMYKYESVDGGHRKRAIRDFFKGEFKIFKSVYYSDLTPDQKKFFKSYMLSFCIYEPLDNFTKGLIFRNINKTTDVNHQEMLNSFGNIAIANVVRETVRLIENVKSDIHPFFETTDAGNFKWINYTNTRLKLEEFVARIYARYYDNGQVGTKTDADLEKMYKDDEIKVKSLSKKVTEHLNFLLTIAEERKKLSDGKGIGWKELNVLSNLYLHLNTKLGKWKLEDANKFYKNFAKVYYDYISDIKEKYTEVVDFEFESAGTTIKETFKNYTTDHSSIEKQNQLMKWVFEHKDLKIKDSIIILDTKRLFTTTEKNSVLARQGFKCLIDGQDLKYDDAEAAHDIAYILGGSSTDLTNCAMIRKEYNRQMKTMTIAEYRELKGFDLVA